MKSDYQIVFDERLHDLGERYGVESRALRQALAWSIASEIARRHPNEMRVIETHPAGGQYDCLSVFKREGPSESRSRDGWRHIVDMNTNTALSHVTHAPWHERRHEERFNWLEVLLCSDRRTYVIEQLERRCGLHVPQRSPGTVSATIGPRLIATLLLRTALVDDSWRAYNGYCDSSGCDSAVRPWLFEALPGVKSSRTRLPDDMLGIREYRYWFLLRQQRDSGSARSEDVRVALDMVRGFAWNGRRRTDLMVAFEKVDRNIDALTNVVFQPAL